MDITIHKTTEYDLFNVDTNQLKGNRSLNKSHIRQMAESIGEDATSLPYSPIIVNEKNQIIDGQHRFAACRQLGLPIYYVVWEGATIADAQRLNASSKNWTPIDYAWSYAKRGNRNYKAYLVFKDRYGLNHDIVMQYLALNEPMTSAMFKRGLLKVPRLGMSEKVAEDLMEMGEFYDGYKRRSFALAFLNIWLNPYGKYDHDTMLKQCRLYGKKIFQDYPSQADNERMIERIYNYGRKIKTRLS